ncbi:MAG: hypothetical protein M1839_002049 [Geoglossum umbratile]|nr:MAG: hypothetical protein M1839_002049 [Geoglossum umbratile]
MEASRALGCLKADEQLVVSRYLRAEDKKMSLASYLLKYLAVAKTCSTPWSGIQINSGQFKKPCYRPADPSSPGAEFNVSHQAGLVVVVANPGTSVKVGVDIVCVNERNDYARIDEKGFGAWVDTYEEMFSDRELNDIKYYSDAIQLEDGTEIQADQLGDLARCCHRHEPIHISLASGERRSFNSGVIVEAKLRRFYAYWCLKEAYIKMSGEALLAEWLRDLEFQNVRAPRPNQSRSAASGSGFGDIVRGIRVLFKGEVVGVVNMELQAFEEQYMIATATSPTTSNGPVFPDFEILDLDRDVYPWTAT